MSVFSKFQGKSMPDSRTSNGGKLEAKPVPNYKPPVGPKGIDNPKTPGLHGSNCGNCGTQGKR